ncbi:carboxymuconolactone decarboxylase family protein [Janibacter melonis]|uniref:carboxymuconolactone decarboxylase family protein n=1 Tax=Janibacter melonis TaxID=262209 RepID=UPI0027E03966|nr:carboxymuconolactone decarboxylase family protein [Janibacter melonis]MCB5991736.1 carboxymuconolactone decarboxylase family protein [Janibacter melonis]
MNSPQARHAHRRGAVRPRLGAPGAVAQNQSLVTIAGLLSAGQSQPLNWHIPDGVENGLTQAEITKSVTHRAFYTGWPKAVSAMNVTKRIFDADKEEAR